MLQTSKSTLPSANLAGESASAAEFYAELGTFLRRQLLTILTVAALVMALALVYLLTTPPSFTALATMIIDTHRVNVFQQESIIGDLPVDTAAVESQVEVLRSENIALSVIKDLHLTEDPEFTGQGGGLLGNLVALASAWIGSEPQSSEFELTRRAARAFAERLAVRRVGLTYIIEISFRAYSPQRAAQIANAVADAYIVDQLNAKYQATQRASVWLQDRIRELREQSTAAERAVVDFKAKNNIVNTGTGGRLMNEQHLSELNSQLVLAQAKTAEAQAKYSRIQDILKLEISDATVTDTLQSEVITKLRQQYLELKAKEAEWSARYGSDHLAAVNLRNQMYQIRRSIVDELGRIAETYKSDYEIAKQRVAALQNGLAESVSNSQTTDQAQVMMHELESSAQSYKTLYDNFLQRYMESVQQQTFPITEARVITAASPPLQKSHPRTLLTLSMAAFVGLGLGLAVARLRDLTDRVFRTGTQVDARLQVPCIAVVPILGHSGGGSASRGRRPGPTLVGDRTISRDEALFWEVVDAPFSRSAEAIRAIKVAVDLNRARKSSKIIGITSTLPDEGKSTIAAALAAVMAQGGSEVLLVDADLRNPSLTRRLAPDAKTGIFDLIGKSARIDELAWSDSATKMKFLPAVMKARVAHTQEILASEATKEAFEQLRSHFDYIVLDLSPLAPVVDVRALAHLVDSFVFVVEWGRTRIETVEHALTEARGVYDNLLGVVLNKANISALSRYESYRHDHFHNKYYSRYGYTD
jgi:succinoglycan biosynthesis transport protein ExoP